MRILLPPSEAKHPGGRGRPIAGRLTSDRPTADRPIEPIRPVEPIRPTEPIEQLRARVFQALGTLLADPPAAARALLLPPSVAEAAIQANLAAATAPTMPAMRRYAGTVYAGLDVPTLSEDARRLAGRRLLIFSGLFGVLRGADPVPVYRVPAQATLPGLGVLAGYWRRQLPELMEPLLGRSGPIVDLRSTDYAAMWQPAPDSSPGRRLLSVRVLSRRPNGSYGVISYQSKLAKGRLAADLLERAAAGRPVRGPEDVLASWQALGGAGGSYRPAGGGFAVELSE
jgi:hypothetical protein